MPADETFKSCPQYERERDGGREGDKEGMRREGEREGERGRERENSNSKTLFSKDCSLGSFRPNN